MPFALLCIALLHTVVCCKLGKRGNIFRIHCISIVKEISKDCRISIVKDLKSQYGQR